MQKAGFCISRTSGKCYVSRSNFAPVPMAKAKHVQAEA
jgi:hypothetical protein